MYHVFQISFYRQLSANGNCERRAARVAKYDRRAVRHKKMPPGKGGIR
jgi:hypothetical protein